MIVDGLNDDHGDVSSRLWVITDSRTKYDDRLGVAADRDIAGIRSGPVLRNWRFGREALGRAEWGRTIRVCAEASAFGGDRAGARENIQALLARYRPRIVVVMASRRTELKQKTRDKDETLLESGSGTVSWQALSPPGSMAELYGTFWERDGTLVMAMQNPCNEEFVYNSRIANHLRRAERVSKGTEEIFYLDHSDPPVELNMLRFNIRRHRALAVDIETIPDTDTITLIGISDGFYTVAVPWDSYRVHGTEEYTRERTRDEHFIVQEILAQPVPKVFHNANYDVPFMQRKGLTVRGDIYDTMLMHGVAHKQFRHGLQACTADEFAIPPWKTLHAAGRSRSPNPLVWAEEPRRLAQYNRQDSFYTWHLAQALAPKVGVML